MARGASAWLGLLSAAFLCGSAFANAFAMNMPSSQPPFCHVIGGEKLPATSGGADALCKAIERAVMRRAPGMAVRAAVRVLSSSMLAATMSVDGRTLPEQKFATMDRELGGDSFERFAGALAEQVAQARL